MVSENTETASGKVQITRRPSGLSSRGLEQSSHYCIRDNAEERIWNSAQDALKINQGSLTHYAALLISYVLFIIYIFIYLLNIVPLPSQSSSSTYLMHDYIFFNFLP